MKNYFSVCKLLMILLLTAISCKKESSPSGSTPPPAATPPSTAKDYSVYVKDKNWTGTFTDDDGKTQYYCVYFKADNTLQWSESIGDYSGQWSIVENHLTLTVDGPVTGVTTDLTGDRKMSNIKSSAADKVMTGEMLNVVQVSLDNTYWAGTSGDDLVFDMALTFLPGSKVQLTFNSHLNEPVIYTKSASGACVRLDYSGSTYFGIITSENVITGTYTYFGNEASSWRVKK